jgi:hypothetical protein
MKELIRSSDQPKKDSTAINSSTKSRATMATLASYLMRG